MSGAFTFYEFFAGGGMARAGLGEGWQCLFANDFDPGKAKAYRDNWGDDDLVEGDVWALEASNLPGQADLAWASSPCQDFSLAGGRAGLTGNRSSAFFGFCRLLADLTKEGRGPRVVVIENVVGLLSSHGGADFAALCTALAECGYWFGALEIDAVRFVPQSRPRVFVIATRKEPPVSLTNVEPVAPFHTKRVIHAFDQLPSQIAARWRWWAVTPAAFSNVSLSSTLEADDKVEWFSTDRQQRILNLLSERHQTKLKDAQARGLRTVGTLFRRMRKEGESKVQRGELRFDGRAGCLRTPRGGSSKQFLVVVDGENIKVRSLTPREGARLMGLDEAYVLPKTKTAAFSVIGDGVVAPVVDYLRRCLLEELISNATEPLEWQESNQTAGAL